MLLQRFKLETLALYCISINKIIRTTSVHDGLFWNDRGPLYGNLPYNFCHKVATLIVSVLLRENVRLF